MSNVSVMGRVTLLAAACALSAAAQNAWEVATPGSDPFFPRPSYFRKHFSTASTHVELQPPARLGDFAVDGKLELSRKNYLDLVTANNPDIGIQKITVEFNRNAITRAFSIFDPFTTTSFTATRRQTPAGTTLVGADTLNLLSQPFSINYQQTLMTGAQYQVQLSTLKTSSNSAFNLLNPQLSGGMNLSVSQPLLRGRGAHITRLPISIARSRLRAADYNLRDALTQLIATAENIYWDAALARETLRVQEESLKLADAALKRAQKELELGATSPLEIFQPEVNFANAQLAVTQAQYRLAQAEDAVRRQIGADLDVKFRAMPIVLTESLDTPAPAERTDAERVVEEALRHRPDLQNAVQLLDVDNLLIEQTNNRLLPDLSLSLLYGSAALAGIPRDPRTGQILAGASSGVGSVLGDAFGYAFPAYGFGLTLRLPIRDRAAAADLADALAGKRLDVLKQRSLEENIRLQVLTAVNSLENSKESIRLAKTARDLAQKRVEADQKRYELGTTTLFFVLASQADFISAETSLVNQITNYRRNELTLLQRTGQLLEERGIVVP